MIWLWIRSSQDREKKREEARSTPVARVERGRNDRRIEADGRAALRGVDIRGEVPHDNIPVFGGRQHEPRVARPAACGEGRGTEDGAGAERERGTYSTLVMPLTCPSSQRTAARVSRSQIAAEPSVRPAATYRPEGSKRASEACEGRDVCTAVG